MSTESDAAHSFEWTAAFMNAAKVLTITKAGDLILMRLGGFLLREWTSQGGTGL
jgi:hypothetical protein